MATNNLTTEQIAKVFAMYLGCDIQGEYLSMDIDTGIKISVPLMRKLAGVYQNGKMMLEGGLFDLSSPKLILRPLSAITDEDTDIADEMIIEGIGSAFDDGRFVGLTYPFLIQRGYAVPLFIAPNHPDNGKTAIELGIANEAFKNQQK